MSVIFHNMMHDCLGDNVDNIVMKFKEVFNYMDDLREVFVRCKKYKLRMNPLKCALVFLLKDP